MNLKKYYSAFSKKELEELLSKLKEGCGAKVDFYGDCWHIVTNNRKYCNKCKLSIILCYWLSVLDINLTINFVKRLKKLEPNKNPHKYELNLIAVSLWDKLGYDKARLIQYLINFVIIFGGFTFLYFNKPEMYFFMFGLTLGGLIVVNSVHFGNLKTLKEKELIKDLEKTK
jgi:hypothetical protein